MPGVNDCCYENFETFEVYNFDLSVAGAYMMGQDVGLIVSTTSRSYIQNIILENRKELTLICSSMK